MNTELDLNVIEVITESSENIEGMTKEALKMMLIRNMCSNDKFVMYEIEGGKLKAFMFATIEGLDGQLVAFIQACYSEKEGSVQVMLDKLINWSVDRGIKKLMFMTKRNPKGFERKYKFNQTYTVLQREI